MRRLARLALVAFACFASGEAGLAREPEPRASEAGARIVQPRVQPRAQRALPAVPPPAGFERWARELSPAERRALGRSLDRLPEWRQREFFRRWERMTFSERRALADELRARNEHRPARDLPPRLRTPELREYIANMSPAEREHFFERAREWRELSRSERRAMRGRLEAFGGLSDAEQRALVDSRFARKSEAERARILGALRDASAKLREHQAERAAPPPSTTPPAP